MKSRINTLPIVLWPVLHYLVLTRDSDGQDEKKYWQDYVEVNRIFAETIIAHYKPGDVSKLIRTFFFSFVGGGSILNTFFF